MSRVLICIPFLLFFALLYPRSQPPAEPDTEPVEVRSVQPRAEWFSFLAMAPEAGFPGGLAWAGLHHTLAAPAASEEPLPDPDIVTFLHKCLERYDREVTGYTGQLYKQERVQGKLNPPEVVRFEFREKPFSVYMKWEKGAGEATAAVYVEGENDNNLLAKPRLLPWVTWRENPRGAKAKRSARYTIDEFGIKVGTERTYKSWKKKQAEGKLHVAYEGVYFVEKAGNRPCYKIHRSRMEQPEDDGVLDVVLYIDTETWLQVGSTLRGKNRELIGDYYFRDLVLNPKYPAGHFSAQLLGK